jgi:uncharacterized membrane protein
MMSSNKRHIAKALSWRLIGTLDTFLISLVLTESISLGLSITSIDFVLKLLLYYFHERVWYHSKFKNSIKRHVYKTFSWRLIGSFTTIVISFLLTGNPTAGLKIGFTETFTKMILYFLHEKIWYKINFGLDKRNSNYVR